MNVAPHPERPLPSASIVVCTHDRPDELTRCLPSLQQYASDGHEVIIVDNCPRDDRTAGLVASYPEFRYVQEPRPGLDIARNRGLRVARGDVVAFTDDDAQVDPGWLLTLLRNMDDPTVAVVTGLTLPLELETEAQRYFEWTNRFSRGFVRREFDIGSQDPLASGQVGAGVNMAIRRSAIEEIGWFDEALDGGTLTRSGGDQEFFYRVLTRGYRIVYEPKALVWHLHRREWNALQRTIYGYGVGVFAWWTRALLEERELTVLKRAPLWFWQHHTRNLWRALLRRPDRLPLDLAWAEFRGALAGPVSYLRARRTVAQARKTAGDRGAVLRDEAVPATDIRLELTPPFAFRQVANRVPLLSIVVPTHNRSALLARGLAALSRQTWPADGFEVVVVADACSDDTAEMTTAYARQSPYTLRVFSHDARSAAATRNLGAVNARGQVLLFLDDDVIARPELVCAHMEAQASDQVVLGYSKPVLPQRPSWWQTDARRWWEDMYRVMREPGHRFTYRDFWSGNVSMPSTLFHQVGGFDARIRGRLEDYELGMRLLKAGVRFRHEPTAIGDHYDSTDLWQWLRRLQEEGKADIQIGEQHPELRNSLFGFEEPDSRVMRTLRRLAFAHHTLGDLLEGLLFRQASVYEWLRLRGRWRRAVGYLREYNYWRGIAAAIGERQKMSAWLQEAPLLPAVAADAPLIEMTTLSSVPLAKDTLQQATRVGARLAVQGIEVLSLPPRPGAEPLREEHLWAALNELLEQQIVPAVVLQMLRASGQEMWAW